MDVLMGRGGGGGTRGWGVHVRVEKVGRERASEVGRRLGQIRVRF